jgi:hypothetical protein
VSKAVEASFGSKGSLEGHVAVPDKDAKAVRVPEGAPPVFLTQAANDAPSSLRGHERVAAWSAVANLGNTAKNANDKVIASTASGVRYLRRPVNSDVSLIYRQLDKTSEDDDKYVIVAIEKGSHRVRWWPDDIEFWQ